jgi:hypothetical protein
MRRCGGSSSTISMPGIGAVRIVSFVLLLEVHSMSGQYCVPSVIRYEIERFLNHLKPMQRSRASEFLYLVLLIFNVRAIHCIKYEPIVASNLQEAARLTQSNLILLTPVRPYTSCFTLHHQFICSEFLIE